MKALILDGGPAYPVPGLWHDEEFNGMTMRDAFAIACLPTFANNFSAELSAKYAYEQADAMIRERAK